MYHIGGGPSNLQQLVAFLSQPDAAFNDPSTFNKASWLFTHQITCFGQWDFLPLAIYLSFKGQSYVLTLCRSDLPQPDTWELCAGHFNWQEICDGQPDSLELFLVFGNQQSRHFCSTFPP